MAGNKDENEEKLINGINEPKRLKQEKKKGDGERQAKQGNQKVNRQKGQGWL